MIQRFGGCLGVVAALVLVAAPAAAQTGDKQAPPHSREPPEVRQLIVKFQANKARAAAPLAQTMASLSQRAGVALAYRRSMSGGAHVLRLPERMPLAVAERIAERLSAGADIEYAVPDRVYRHLLEPDDELYGRQWHLRRAQAGREGTVNLPPAWNVTTGRNSVVIAVIDTGLLPHRDIDSDINDGAGRVATGYDFIADPANANDGDGRDPDASDPGDFVLTGECGRSDPPSNLDSSWHGTHVAGIIGALSNNRLGVAGIDWSARIQPLRVLGKCGGLMSDIVDAMRWAAGLPVAGVPPNPTPAKVLNLSLGGAGACTQPEQSAINAVLAAGASVVVAAGNENANAADFSPGNCAGVVTVAANDIRGQRAVYSNFGSVVEISAPGGDFQVDPGILSTADSGRREPLYDNAYFHYQGTSMAAPQVAGVIALLLAKNRNLAPAELMTIVQSTARAFPRYGDQFDCTPTLCGDGIVDAPAALAATPAPDTAPEAFSFEPVTGAAPGTIVVSNSVTVSGVEEPLAITVVGGEYSIDGGPFTSAAGTVASGSSIRVRVTAPAGPLQTASATLTVGDLTRSFIVTTRGPNTLPAPFILEDRVGVAPSSIVVSNPVTVSGLEAPAAVTVSGGEYSIGCTEAFTSVPGIISEGQRICVRHVAASASGASVHTTLDVGGRADVFTSTTGAPALPGPGASDGGGGGGSLDLAVLALLAARAFRRRRAVTRATAPAQ